MGKRLIIPGVAGPLPDVPQSTVGDLIDLLETCGRDEPLVMATHQEAAEGTPAEYCYLYVNAHIADGKGGRAVGFYVKDDERGGGDSGMEGAAP